jgi:pyrophosphatase PpaX
MAVGSPRPLAVLFDLDGTLIDSIALLLASMNHTFEGRANRPTDDEWIATLGIPLPTQLTPFIASEEDRQQLIARYRAFQNEHHNRLMTVYGGVAETLSLLKTRGHPMGVVTSKGNAMMDRGLKFIGAYDYMDVRIGFDSCEIHKPDPHPVQLAVEKLGYTPGETVFVGDSPHDIQAGNSAGVISVAALWGPFTREMLEPYKPAYFLQRSSDLPPLLERIARDSAG